MPCDPRFLAGSGREVFTGNELLVKGALETEGGVHLLTGYPGSPVAGFFDTLGDIKDLLNANGVRAFQANNEALGAAAVIGSQMAPCRSIATMKSVGVHVASDALAIGNLAGANPDGGAMVIMGDDPWCDSTQVPADSRFLCEHLRMPVVDLSKVLLPPRTWQQELKMPERFAKTLQAARDLGLNRIECAKARDSVAPLGFIVTGMAGPYLEHVLADLGLAGVFPILHMGMSYPTDVDLVREFTG